jgi:hypothetical protein
VLLMLISVQKLFRRFFWLNFDGMFHTSPVTKGELCIIAQNAIRFICLSVVMFIDHDWLAHQHRLFLAVCLMLFSSEKKWKIFIAEYWKAYVYMLPISLKSRNNYHGCLKCFLHINITRTWRKLAVVFDVVHAVKIYLKS